MHTASATTVVLPRSALGVVGIPLLEALPGLTWSWMGTFAPPEQRPRFIRVEGPSDSLRVLLRICAAVARSDGRSAKNRTDAVTCAHILRARLSRCTGQG